MPALLNRAAALIRRVSPRQPADRLLRASLARDTRLSPSEKHRLSAAVFAYFRWLRFTDPKAPLPRQVADALARQRRHDADPSACKPEALAALALPDWLHTAADPDDAFLRALQTSPVLWLRARSAFAQTLPASLGGTRPADPAALRLAAPPDLSAAFRYTGTNDLFKTAAFRDGLFEIQDLASQLVAHACAPRPGETWWDACAGEGGKSLHLSDLMRNRGLIRATDRNLRRLASLRARAARAQVFNYRADPWDGSARLPFKTRFDGILVDAPCSGAGTWRRNPHARWTTSPDDVRDLAAVQLRLLENVLPLLKPGGRLVYSVCTFTRAETDAVADALSAARPGLQPLPLFSTAPRLHLHPALTDANAMFLAAWRKT